MGNWQNKTAVSTLSSGNKLMCEQAGITKTCEMDDIASYVSGTVKETTYGYLSKSVNTTCTEEDTWYIFQGVFTNNILNNFTVAADGITYDGTGGDFEIEWGFCGQSDDTAKISIGVVKNGTFTGTELTTGDILAGSMGIAQAAVIGIELNGDISPRSLWAGTLENDDKFTLVVRSSVAGTVITPESAAATIHRLY